MFDFLRFVLSSFWTWLGFVLIIGAVGDIIVKIIRSFTGKYPCKNQDDDNEDDKVDED